jgi:hypothetical protein
MKDDRQSARHRIDGAKALHSFAQGGSGDKPAAESIRIVINLGADEKLVIDQPKQPSSPWPEVKGEDDRGRNI